MTMPMAGPIPAARYHDHREPKDGEHPTYGTGGKYRPSGLPEPVAEGRHGDAGAVRLPSVDAGTHRDGDQSQTANCYERPCVSLALLGHVHACTPCRDRETGSGADTGRRRLSQ